MTGAAFKKQRRALGLIQAKLAKRIGVHRITISKWEAGMVPVPPPIALLMRLLVEKEEAKKVNGQCLEKKRNQPA
jgi:transcriptional regulator with XRE-family HTH domain